MIRVAAALALAAALAGCGGEERLRTLALDAAPAGVEAPGPGKTVLRFVQAARARDAVRMEALLSASTRETLGPGALYDLAEDFSGFTGGRIVLSRALEGGWAVGAVAGRSEDDDPAAYAAALRLERGSWRLELGGALFGRLRPGPLEQTDARPELRAEAQAGDEIEELLAWVDDRPVRAFPRRGRFTAEIRGRLDRELAAGEHTVVVFATTADTAGALAWPFEVTG